MYFAFYKVIGAQIFTFSCSSCVCLWHCNSFYTDETAFVLTPHVISSCFSLWNIKGFFSFQEKQNYRSLFIYTFKIT